jgi:hypothetical protein
VNAAREPQAAAAVLSWAERNPRAASLGDALCEARAARGRAVAAVAVIPIAADRLCGPELRALSDAIGELAGAQLELTRILLELVAESGLR